MKNRARRRKEKQPAEKWRYEKGFDGADLVLSIDPEHPERPARVVCLSYGEEDARRIAEAHAELVRLKEQNEKLQQKIKNLWHDFELEKLKEEAGRLANICKSPSVCPRPRNYETCPDRSLLLLDCSKVTPEDWLEILREEKKI